MKRHFIWIAMVAIFASMGCTATTEVALPNLFSDHMVLQREKPVPVWGWATPGETMTVSFAGETERATADKEGKWMVKLPAMKASARGRSMTITSADGKRKTTLRDVLVGEVWLCSGQSNMDWRVDQSDGRDETVARANYPLIRYFGVPHVASPLPTRDVNSSWELCSPSTVENFSAVAFYFGERLFKELDVPVGLIKSAWGGTRIEPWTPEEGFATQKSLAKDAAFLKEAKAKDRQALKTFDMEIIRTWADETDAALLAGTKLPAYPKLPKSDIYTQGHPSKPTALFNSMIAPLIPYAMRGVIWYQGESNNKDGMLYRDRMEALISSWRSRWGGEAFPFYYVQLCPFFWAYGDFGLQGLWEAQTAALEIPNTGLVGTADIADPGTWHPRNKLDVGNRLALWALAKNYGQKDLVYSGPLFKAMKINGSKATLTFRHTAGGLKSLDGKPLRHLLIAGKDKVFYNADVKINGDTLVLSSKDVPAPVAVRYGWSRTAQPNLGNGANLPAIAFRTDDWVEVISTPRLGEWYADTGDWSQKDGIFTQSDDRAWAKLFTGYQDWKNYTYEFEARLTTGRVLMICFRTNPKGFYRCFMESGKVQISSEGGGKGSKKVSCEIKNDTWHKIKFVLKGDTVEMFVDGKSILTYTNSKENPHQAGGVGVGCWRATAQFRNVKVTDEAGKVLFQD